MKKKLRLKKEVKERLIALAVSLGFILLFIGGIILYSYRIDQINSGELVVISDSQMDR
jgi:hypothetical protein